MKIFNKIMFKSSIATYVSNGACVFCGKSGYSCNLNEYEPNYKRESELFRPLSSKVGMNILKIRYCAPCYNNALIKQFGERHNDVVSRLMRKFEKKNNASISRQTYIIYHMIYKKHLRELQEANNEIQY